MNALTPYKEKVNTVRDLLNKAKSQIALALPKHLDADRLLRITMTSVQKTPKLLDCDRASLLGAVIQSAQLGLEPDGVTGEAYLVPYKDKAQLIPGYKGLMKLARQSGEVSTISARVVREGDFFKYHFGMNEVLEHEPNMNDDTGDLTFVYAVAKLKDGGEQFEVMSRRQVEAIRNRSRAAESGPWVTDYEEMAKKTVLRRLCKMLPQSTALARAIALDERVDAGLDQEFETVIDVPEDRQARHIEAPRTLDDLKEQAEPEQVRRTDAVTFAEMPDQAARPNFRRSK